MGCPAGTSGSWAHRTFGISSIFFDHPWNLEIVGRCCVGDPAVPEAKGVGLCRCTLRSDGRCCLAVRFGAHGSRHDCIPDRDDGRCRCVMGPASSIPLSRTEVSCSCDLRLPREAELQRETISGSLVASAVYDSRELHSPDQKRGCWDCCDREGGRPTRNRDVGFSEGCTGGSCSRSCFIGRANSISAH